MHEEVIGKEEKEDIVGIKDTYLWPQTSTHHQKPYQSYTCSHNRLIIGILKDLLRPLTKGQVCNRPMGGRAKNRGWSDD